jgi:multiple sugar transport system substrate-binding protein
MIMLNLEETLRRTRAASFAALAATVLSAGFGSASAQETLTVMGHAVHQAAVTGEAGGNLGAKFESDNNVRIHWITNGVVPLHEQMFRDASLNSGSVDVDFVLNRFANENIANLFEPLDDLLASDPIKDFDGISASMLEAMTFDGHVYGIPYRHATQGVVYNKEMLAEQGLTAPPKTIDELADYARKLTYKRADGTQVYGLVLSGQGASNIIDIVRAFGGEFISPDLKIHANEEGMVKAVSLIAELYQEGAMPRESIGFTTEDASTYMQQGRAAMSIDPFSRYTALNDPKKSTVAGQIDVAPLYLADGSVVPGKTEIWSLAIPKNAPHKELAWKFIKLLSSPEGTIDGAVNGNGPVRPSAYEDARVQAAIPYWQTESAAVKVARVPLPGFAEAARVDDMLREEVQAAMLGAKTPQQAMDDLVARVAPLLPQ